MSSATYKHCSGWSEESVLERRLKADDRPSSVALAMDEEHEQEGLIKGPFVGVSFIFTSAQVFSLALSCGEKRAELLAEREREILLPEVRFRGSFGHFCQFEWAVGACLCALVCLLLAVCWPNGHFTCASQLTSWRGK